jgi:hypothetical protein
MKLKELIDRLCLYQIQRCDRDFNPTGTNNNISTINANNISEIVYKTIVMPFYIPLVDYVISNDLFIEIIDSLNKINPDDIILIGWSSTIRFRVASKSNTFLTVRPNHLDNNKSTINDSSYLTDICVDCLNEFIVNRSDKIYIDEINRYIKLINHMYPNNVIIHWSPFKQETEGMYVTPIDSSVERITEETNGLFYDQHFSEFGHEQISEYFYELIKNYDNNKKVKLL